MCGGCKIDTFFSCVLSLLVETKSKSCSDLTQSAFKPRKRYRRRIMLPGLLWRLKPLHIKRSLETIILFSRLRINSWGCFYGAGRVDSDFSQMESKFCGQTQATGLRNNAKEHDCLICLMQIYTTEIDDEHLIQGQTASKRWPSDYFSIKKVTHICRGVYVYVHVHVSDVCDSKSHGFIRFFIFFFHFFKPLEKQFSTRQSVFPTKNTWWELSSRVAATETSWIRERDIAICLTTCRRTHTIRIFRSQMTMTLRLRAPALKMSNRTWTALWNDRPSKKDLFNNIAAIYFPYNWTFPVTGGALAIGYHWVLQNSRSVSVRTCVHPYVSFQFARIKRKNHFHGTIKSEPLYSSLILLIEFFTLSFTVWILLSKNVKVN